MPLPKNQAMRIVTLLLLLPLTASAKVWTYPSPGKEFASSKYEVTVYQNDDRQPLFTYRYKNSDERLAMRMTDLNTPAAFLNYVRY